MSFASTIVEGQGELEAKSGTEVNMPGAPESTSILDGSTTTAKEKETASTTEKSQSKESQENSTSENTKPHKKKRTDSTSTKTPSGWPSRYPFQSSDTRLLDKIKDEQILFSELTWKEKLAYRKEFWKEYLSETKQCLPYLKRLCLMILRISPWRVIGLVCLHVVNGLLPALGLKTKGRFIMMVRNPGVSKTKYSCNRA